MKAAYLQSHSVNFTLNFQIPLHIVYTVQFSAVQYRYIQPIAKRDYYKFSFLPRSILLSGTAFHLMSKGTKKLTHSDKLSNSTLDRQNHCFCCSKTTGRVLSLLSRHVIHLAYFILHLSYFLSILVQLW